MRPAPPVEAEPEAPEPSPAGWKRFLEFVAGEDRVLASYLQQGGLLEMSEAGVKLGLEGLYRTYLKDRENMALLEQLLERFFARRMTVTLVSPTEGEGGSEDPPGPDQESAEDIIDEALRMFGGTVK